MKTQSELINSLREALQFYADRRRYDGPNQEPIEGDPHGLKDFPYMWSVDRDNGSIARKALEQIALVP